jgi:hypothetical protein
MTRFGEIIQPYPPVSQRLPLQDYFFNVRVNGVHLILKKNPPPLRGEDKVEVSGGFEPP